MIYVDLEEKEPPLELLREAKRVTALLEKTTTQAERNKIIDENKAVWGKFKDWLLMQSLGKCWFSEAKDCYSHWDVEHFRPKKSAKNMDGTEREGYWWLAFDWTNFRICGKVGNVKKGTFFPLRAGTLSASSANRNTDDEIYYLLDPTNRQDPLLLTFGEDGSTTPREDLTGWSHQRADYSIKRLKLDEFQPLIDARKDIWQKCRRRINKCANLLGENDRAPSATKRQAVEDKLAELIAMTKPNEPLSAVAAECLRKSGLPWAQRIATSARG
ncbi:MAG TPA: hypothetical protein VH280_02155 [Verrucomicrobiae bacterium]|jgi:uncharacterized protein (TIGR02646 family)|nr:hypothetical protein [Verrucomicrobiae bacterium]